MILNINQLFKLLIKLPIIFLCFEGQTPLFKKASIIINIYYSNFNFNLNRFEAFKIPRSYPLGFAAYLPTRSRPR